MSQLQSNQTRASDGQLTMSYERATTTAAGVTITQQTGSVYSMECTVLVRKEIHRITNGIALLADAMGVAHTTSSYLRTESEDVRRVM